LNLHTKLILTDADGVLLAWEHAFDEWARAQGYKKVRADEYGMNEKYNIPKKESQYLITKFNQSAWVGWISPYRDAIKYVRKLHEEHGFIFRVITSFEQDMFSVRLREMNLHNTFGANVFDSIHCIGNQDKRDYLKPYEGTGCFFLEDKPSNADKAGPLGIQGVLFNHPYNKDHVNDDLIRVDNWKEFHDLAVNWESSPRMLLS